MTELPERYVHLCLRIDRHIDGFVDAYLGPPERRALVRAEEPIDPHVLRDEALALIEVLPSEGLEPQRERWLGSQLRAIECVLARLCGAFAAREPGNFTPLLTEQLTTADLIGER